MNNLKELLMKPVWQMTGEEFLFLSRHASVQAEAQTQPTTDTEKKYVYGILGIAKLFGCSLPTANRIKKSGKIDKAITQIGRKIIVDAELALELAGKKTFNVSAIVAAALKNGTVLRYAAELPEEKRKVLYIDTEQSPYHCLKVMKRILRMAGLPDDRDSGYLEFLALRKYTPEQRISIVEQAIYHSPDIGLVIIDGIRDMVYDINSPGESTRIISKLMQWTDDRQIHIHTILHQNKGDENARGHIGTELNNKAETVLLVEKDKGNSDISHVSAMHIRAMDFEPFAFRINDRALPELAEGYKPEARKPGRPSVEKFDPYKDISEPQHRAALEDAFALKEEYGYKELEDTLIKTYLAEGVRLNHQNAVALITMLRNKRMIVQENGRKYSFKPDYHY